MLYVLLFFLFQISRGNKNHQLIGDWYGAWSSLFTFHQALLLTYIDEGAHRFAILIRISGVMLIIMVVIESVPANLYPRTYPFVLIAF